MFETTQRQALDNMYDGNRIHRIYIDMIYGGYASYHMRLNSSIELHIWLMFMCVYVWLYDTNEVGVEMIVYIRIGASPTD